MASITLGSSKKKNLVQPGSPNVLLKSFSNFFVSYKGNSYTEDSALKEIIYRGDMFPGEWRNVYTKHKDAYLATLAEGITRDYFTVHAFLKGPIWDEVKNSFIAECKELDQDWQIQNNTKVLADVLELDENERLVLDLAISIASKIDYDHYNTLERISACGEGDPLLLYSRILNKPIDELRPMMSGFLIKSGIVVTDKKVGPFYGLNPDMTEILVQENLTVSTLEEALFPSNISTELDPTAYPHVAKEIARTEAIIANSLENRTIGTNLMFWGIPGTGKTELALALAKKNGWKLKSIGDISPTDTTEKSRAQRLASLKVAIKLYARDEKTILLFDEMEDLFKTDNNATFSKAFINRIIETTPIPIIWTTNNLLDLGNAVLRRMLYNIEFGVPPVEARKTIWQMYVEKHGVDLTEQMVEELANEFEITPSLIANAVKIAKTSGLEQSELKEVIQSLNTLVHYGNAPTKHTIKMRSDTPYDASCVNTDHDLNEFTDRLCNARPEFSLCLYGPPGTGKSEYGRYLAKRLGKKVLYKRASDLLSMWVGENEKNIADAFKQARDEKKVLIIDEGDSFLQNREKAQRGWEVSMVNEMLSQMENHPEPFIITTNMMDDLDPASLRRFTFKMNFKFMKPEQSRNLFKAYFGVDAPPELNSMDCLAPGDFANIVKQVRILNIKDVDQIMKMLKEELALKPQMKNSRPIGFGRDDNWRKS